MSGPRIGELFAGYGGLGLGVRAVYGGTVAWVSDVPGIRRNEVLRACGNGVVPQQVAEALRIMEAW